MSEKARELVLPPGRFVFVQDGTKGTIKTYVGPTVVNQTGTDIPKIYDPKTGTFETVDTLEQAMTKSFIAPEGFYAILTNPAKDNIHPVDGQQISSSPDLQIGHKIVIPGPTMFALWPGQACVVIKGHHLRSNQYLLCRVYNEDMAKANWSQAVVKTQGTGDPKDQQVKSTPPDLTVGKQLIIKGTEVSFYIPPTGISVVPSTVGGKDYVREALTLEQLEYCILVDEDGTKRYPRGPAVVFPEPTEEFKSDKGEIKFGATELNKIQGIHVKVTKAYRDPDLINPTTREKGLDLNAGDEIFIKGGPTEDGGVPIYFPREEHAIVRYDGRSKIFAVAVPRGEARYVMDRLGGEINLVHGPTMLLPNPVHEVIVRRALSNAECEAWYPGNAEALAHNAHLRELEATSPTTRSGVVSDGDYRRSLNRGEKTSARGVRSDMSLASEAAVGTMAMASSRLSAMDQSRVGASNAGPMGDEISRQSSYSQPRSIVINSKYEGAPRISPFIGYAVMIINSKGDRRVVQGPANILLEYDETLEVMSLSTGKPKSTDKLFRTGYLRTANNKVSDYIGVETQDHVNVNVKLLYLVNFEGDPNRWWNVDNYVKFLTDHARSVLKGAVKKTRIEDFYANSTDFVRDLLLGATKDGSRPGMTFKENGMRVVDVEVLDTTIPDTTIAGMLANVQKETVKSNLILSQARRALEVTVEQEAINQKDAQVKMETVLERLGLEARKVSVEATQQRMLLEENIKAQTLQAKLEEAAQAVIDIKSESDLARAKAKTDLETAIARERLAISIEQLVAETQSAKEKFGALSGEFTTALLALSSNETMVKVAEAMSAQTWVGGRNLVDVLQKSFGAETPIGAMLAKVTQRSLAGVAGNGNGASKTAPAATTGA